MTGIDIGSKTIKIVELESKAGRYFLKSSGVVGYSGNDISKIEDDKELATIGQIVKRLHSEARVSSQNIVLSIPEPHVFTRTIRFPMLTDAEITSAVKWEAEQYIPIPINEAIIQHTILERKEKSNPPEVIVLLVAAPRVLVEKYTKIITFAGLNPIAVETELLALSRSIAPIDRTVLIVDFGALSTNISVTKNSLLRFSRSIPIAGEAFTRAVSQGLGVNNLQAEEYKKTYGLSASQIEGKVKRTLDPVLKLVVDEIKKAVNYFQTEEKGDAPSAVMISGGTSGMPEMVPTLSNLLSMEVLVGNAFSKIVVDAETAKKLAPYAPLYSVAVGLAMREE